MMMQVVGPTTERHSLEPLISRVTIPCLMLDNVRILTFRIIVIVFSFSRLLQLDYIADGHVDQGLF
jgi:hypothetical protein